MPKNTFAHFEIVAKDPKKATEFYSSVFDWEMRFLEDMNYFSFNEGLVGGGFTEPDEVISTGSIMHVNTDDIQKTLDLVKLNGGAIIREKTKIPTIGWYGLFKDPEGNLIGLFKSL